MKLLVCGGRGYSDKDKIYEVLDELSRSGSVTHVIHGAGGLADTLAGQWSRDRKIQSVVCPANWNELGLQAGPIRNARMADLMIQGDLVVAFPGGKGTSSMVSIAEKRNLKILYVP